MATLQAERARVARQLAELLEAEREIRRALRNKISPHHDTLIALVTRRQALQAYVDQLNEDISRLRATVVLAVKTFKQHNCEPGEISKLDVEVRSLVTLTVTLKKVRQWLNGGTKNPKEAVMKE